MKDLVVPPIAANDQLLISKDDATTTPITDGAQIQVEMPMTPNHGFEEDNESSPEAQRVPKARLSQDSNAAMDDNTQRNM